MLKVLILGAHGGLYIKPGVHLFAGIEDVVRIKDVFSLFEEFKDVFGE